MFMLIGLNGNKTKNSNCLRHVVLCWPSGNSSPDVLHIMIILIITTLELHLRGVISDLTFPHPLLAGNKVYSVYWTHKQPGVASIVAIIDHSLSDSLTGTSSNATVSWFACAWSFEKRTLEGCLGSKGIKRIKRRDKEARPQVLCTFVYGSYRSCNPSRCAVISGWQNMLGVGKSW